MSSSNTTHLLTNVPPKSELIDKNDEDRSRWNRHRNLGFKVGKFYQCPPMFFTYDHHPLWLADMYRGRSAFLIGGGPSFGELDKTPLLEPGMVTMSLNNSPRTFRPNLWCSVDAPDHFIKSIWLDPKIQKFVPICHGAKKIFDNDKWEWTDLKVCDCPNVVYYRRNEKFDAERYLWEDTINWGNHKKYGGGRSVMLAAMRILYLMGFRTVYLLGVDFKMDESTKYHFDQDRSKSSIKGNNTTYKLLNERFTQLRPIFEKESFQVYNCNLDSGLTSFDKLCYNEAITRCREEMGLIEYSKESTLGLYDTPTPDKGKRDKHGNPVYGKSKDRKNSSEGRD